jgi:hypothetical protein
MSASHRSSRPKSVVEVIDDRGLTDPTLLELVEAIAEHNLRH